MIRTTSLALLALLCAVTSASGASIVVGHHNLLPNTPGQEIDIYVNGGDPFVQGVAFRVLVGDGGPFFGGSDSGPLITGEIIGPGMIFETDNVGVSDVSVAPLYLDLQTTVNESSSWFFAGGLLGTIIVDTTGWNEGSWPLSMNYDNIMAITGNAAEGTILPFVEILDITDGSITIVPEPAGLTLAALVGLVALLCRRKD